MRQLIAVFVAACVLYALPVQNIDRPDSTRLIGQWLSDERFEAQPRVALTIRQDGATHAGVAVLRGLTEGENDRATLMLSFCAADWDGQRLVFKTEIADEGVTAWELRLTKGNEATLRVLAEDGKPIEEGPSWRMAKKK